MEQTDRQTDRQTISLDLPGEEHVEGASRFRLSVSRMLLTYRTHLDKELYKAFASEKFNGSLKFIRLAHETGDEVVNYLHTHVVVELSKPCNFVSSRCLDYMEIHPHIRKLKNKKAFEDAKVYISKEDIENTDLKKDEESLFTRVSKCSTVQDALSKFAISPGDANGVVTMFNMKNGNLLSRYSYTPNMDWQLRIIEEVNEVPDNRTINWIFDKKGNSGKTALAKWLCIENPNRWFIAKDMGTSRDCATIVTSAISSGWEAWGVIIDLPRQTEEHVRIYQYIEELKDGFVTSQKYCGRTVLFDSPHVFVMANWLPQVDCLSLDRWKIREINSNKELVELSAERVRLLKENVDAPDNIVSV